MHAKHANRVAVIYDVHANLPALRAVLEKVRQLGVDHIVFGGDMVPGPMPRETLDCLRNIDVTKEFLLGNTDREVLARMSGEETSWYQTAQHAWREPIDWAAEVLDFEQQQWLSQWTANCRLNIEGLGQVLFCHATPLSDAQNFTRLTEEEKLLPMFENLGVDLVVCGHTHMQFDRMVGKTRVVNAGSVGMPFGKPGAYWLLLGPQVQLQYTVYDLERACRAIRETRFPQADEFATRFVLQPPTEDEMLKVFT